jgi:DNA-binding transcriptional LysR family regulator
MNLRAIDLNLLVALNALLTERHVTRAADSVGLSQPAMSNALARLRHIFADELLVRGAGGMQATPRAIALAEPVRQVLRQIERVLSSEDVFDPAISSRDFTIRLSDLLAFLLLPPLFALIRKEAPRLKFDTVHLSPTATVEALERDEIDLAISMGLVHASSIRSELLLRDRMVCVMRKGHPLTSRALTLEAFLDARHVKVSMSPTDLRFVDAALARLGLARKVALNVPHWLLVPHILRQSDLLAVMPWRFARALRQQRLAIRELPLPSEPFEWSIYRHRRHDGDPALAWLGSQLAAAAEAITDR